MPSGELLEYYGKRVDEYDEIYHKPERQKDLRRLEAVVRDFCKGEHVLELAAGTGHWTQGAAEVALSVHCTDAGSAVLERARQRLRSHKNVSFELVDAYDLATIKGSYTAVICGFWWSHVNRRDIRVFLDGLSRALAQETRILFFDNRYVRGSSTPVFRTDSDNNTYQRRVLDDGSECIILKNFPTESELRTYGSLIGHDIRIGMLTYFWWMSLRLTQSEEEWSPTSKPVVPIT